MTETGAETDRENNDIPRSTASAQTAPYPADCISYTLLTGKSTAGVT